MGPAHASIPAIGDAERSVVMPRMSPVLSCLLFALGAPLSTAHARQSVSECVQVDPEAAPLGMSLRVANQCEYTVRCELRWNLRCEGDAADTPQRPMSLALKLGPGGKREVLASGAACGEKVWEIADDAWECKEVP